MTETSVETASPDTPAGLTLREVTARQRDEGFNELARQDRRTPLRIVLEVVREPMLALLLGGGVVYLLIGGTSEAIILLAFATMSVVITVVQESRTERVLDALRDLSSPRALVIREGRRMVIDPVCSLVFEAESEETDVMRRPPRAPDGPLFSGALIVWSLLQGACALALVGAILVVSVHRGMPENEVRALTFVSLVLTIVSLIFVNRTFSASILTTLRRPNPTLAWVLAGVALMLAVTLVPFARGLLAFGPLHANDLGVTVGAGALVLCALEWIKPYWRARLQA